MVYGLIELYEANFEVKYLQSSIELTKKMIEQFWDEENGGLFFTIKSTDDSVPRLKETYDGAVPSGNSVAFYNLLRLARLTGDSRFEEYANKLLRALSEEVTVQLLGHTFMLSGLEFALGSTFNVVLVGDPLENGMVELLAALRKNYLSNLTITMWNSEMNSLVPGVVYEKIDGKPTALCLQKPNLHASDK